MKSLWKHLSNLFHQRRETDGMAAAALVCMGALGTLLVDRQHRELLELEIVDKYIAESDEPDVLFYISHRHYLSNTFTRRERIDCALTHYRYESERHGTRYKDAVYRDGGLCLWTRTVGDVTYALRLRATTDLRHEGGISIVLMADEVCLCEMSYAWVDAGIFGFGEAGIVPFITRNQSVRFDAAPLRRFREHFPQNSPSYFCFAAMQGVAAYHGMTRIAGIKHDCQVAFEERYASGFRNSYCEFWKSFGAIELGRLAYLMPVPLCTPPMAKVSAKHRRRALDRRRHWAEILQESQAALARPEQPVSANARTGARVAGLRDCSIHLVLAALAVLPSAVQAADIDDDGDGVMTTDRPDFGESAEVVGKGHFQIETGYQYDRSRDGGLKFATTSTPTLLRLGLSKNWELRAETDGFIGLRTDDSASGTATRVHGFSDTELGLKWHMQDGDDDDARPSVAWLLHFEFPSGSSAFRGTGVRPSLRAPMEWELPQGFSIGMMPGVAVESNADGKRYVYGLYEIALEKAWSDAFHSFVEFAAQQVTTAANGGSVLTFDLGASYLVTKTLQLDLSVYRGLNRFSPDWVANAGLSVKF